ncbi:phosphatidylethanolamine-binding protein [Lophiotrema nucula]|uniref:Phosphatidylethanolamine-binding protein n=1 Tax=Lophiotrema nucula TaxID=690887 RepID=A0A6A5Z5V6_9PLEO|nr:phosphatidylethanolamine-binding protein [Lophiotrema nucula]
MSSFFILSLLTTASWASPLISRQTCPASGITAARAAQVRSAFQTSKIIPDTVPDIQPMTELRVKYANINENLGNSFSAAQTLQEPTFSFDPESGYNPSTTKYTYIQVDPDAPGPELPVLRHFLHHIVYDVQPSCIATQTPKTQARYMPLTPLSVSAHRYISLLYRQPPTAELYAPPTKLGG